MAGIVVQDPLQDLGMHQGPIKERRGHGVSEKGGGGVRLLPLRAL